MSIVLDGTAGVTFPNSTTQAAAAAPGGSTTQLQYNNAGALGGISGVTTNGTRLINSTTMSVGGATPATSGSGITFPATASPSTDVNTLDDYEEGTWTATDASGAGLGNLGSGYYTKIGNYVFLAVYCTWPTTSNGATGQVGGVPFAAVNTYYQGAIQSSGGGSPIISRMSGSTIIIYAAGNNGVSNASLSGSFVLISFGYLMS